MIKCSLPLFRPLHFPAFPFLQHIANDTNRIQIETMNIQRKPTAIEEIFMLKK
jgi:hypothetical protein